MRTTLVPERNPGDQKTAAALTVLAEMLGGSAQTSVLARELMLTGKALFIDAGYDGLSVDPTTFNIALMPAPGLSNAEAEAALDAALEKFRNDGPDPAQLERVKTQVRAAEVYKQDSAHGRAYDYGQGLSIGLGIEDVNDWPDILAAVTPEDIRAAAELVLDSRADVTGWLLPAATPAITPAAAPAMTPAGDAPAASTDPANPGESQ
jgi:zinc protease